jgi:hypothetical protein
VNVTVGFWADFTAEGRISSAIRCPANYCGCRNTPLPADSFACLLLPVFSPEFRYHSDVALCANNRAGVLSRKAAGLPCAFCSTGKCRPLPAFLRFWTLGLRLQPSHRGCPG